MDDFITKPLNLSDTKILNYKITDDAVYMVLSNLSFSKFVFFEKVVYLRSNFRHAMMIFFIFWSSHYALPSLSV